MREERRSLARRSFYAVRPAYVIYPVRFFDNHAQEEDEINVPIALRAFRDKTMPR